MGYEKRDVVGRILRLPTANKCILAERRKSSSRSSSVEFFMQLSGVLFVIVENGAPLPSWLGYCQGKVSDTVVLVSAADEISTRFSARAIQR